MLVASPRPPSRKEGSRNWASGLASTFNSLASLRHTSPRMMQGDRHSRSFTSSPYARRFTASYPSRFISRIRQSTETDLDKAQSISRCNTYLEVVWPHAHFKAWAKFGLHDIRNTVSSNRLVQQAEASLMLSGPIRSKFTIARCLRHSTSLMYPHRSAHPCSISSGRSVSVKVMSICGHATTAL